MVQKNLNEDVNIVFIPITLIEKAILRKNGVVSHIVEARIELLFVGDKEPIDDGLYYIDKPTNLALNKKMFTK